jgi:N,N-dimethylformamidase beta subunit-like protein
LSPLTRRSALGLLTVGAAALAGCTPGRPDNATTRENALPGDAGWKVPADGVTDLAGQIQGYASATSVNRGESIDFHVSVATARPFTVSVFRVGHYGGLGGRRMHVSDPLPGTRHARPAADPVTGLIECDWPSSYTLAVPGEWTSGYYLAVFETRDGLRSCTPFVVRDDKRRADFMVVLPFTTYQAYNFWPADGKTAKNLYHGYRPDGTIGGLPERAFQVSFNRPYSGTGMPAWSRLDVATVQWAEAAGYDVAYATSLDLHEGRVGPSVALIFPGHDEYWSADMRAAVEQAFHKGTHTAFLAANNIYWHIRVSAGGRVVTCYKDDPDPAPDEHGPTRTWRTVGAQREKAEQRLLGVQYCGILAEAVPLVVTNPAHWMWSGTGVRQGDEIKDLVAVEADTRYSTIKLSYKGKQTLLSHSPFQDSMGRGAKVQNTSVCEKHDGTIMFCAGTFHWPLALVRSEFTDERIRRATRNLFDRFLKAA